MLRKLKYMFTLLFLILSTFIFAKENDGREIIKAYEKGKPAQMKIEITKVKSDNYIDLIIDRANKKIYKDISESVKGKEKGDFKGKLFITDYIDNVEKTEDIYDMYPKKTVTLGEKTYLVVDYSGNPEPEKLYFWVMRKGKVKKLYTGVMAKEYIDFTKPEANIEMNIVKNQGEKLNQRNSEAIFVKIADIKRRVDSPNIVTLDTKDIVYYFEGKEKRDKIPVELYFDTEGTQAITLGKGKEVTTLYGKVLNQNDRVVKSNQYKLKAENFNRDEFPIKATLISRKAKFSTLDKVGDEDNYIYSYYFVDRFGKKREGRNKELNVYIESDFKDSYGQIKLYRNFGSEEVKLKPTEDIKNYKIVQEKDFVYEDFWGTYEIDRIREAVDENNKTIHDDWENVYIYNEGTTGVTIEINDFNSIEKKGIKKIIISNDPNHKNYIDDDGNPRDSVINIIFGSIKPEPKIEIITQDVTLDFGELKRGDSGDEATIPNPNKNIEYRVTEGYEGRIKFVDAGAIQGGNSASVTMRKSDAQTQNSGDVKAILTLADKVDKNNIDGDGMQHYTRGVSGKITENNANELGTYRGVAYIEAEIVQTDGKFF